MMAFPVMLVDAAQKAGMKVPPNPDEFAKEEYPHFHVFCEVQLGRPIRWGEHWENAEIIAKLTDEEIKAVTLERLIGLGLHFQS